MKKTESSHLTTLLNSPDRFTLIKEDEINDSFGKLVWGPTMKRVEGMKYCEKSKIWRMPTIEELYSLVNNASDPCFYPIFKDTKTDGWYLSSTKTSWNKNYYRCVSFCYGDVRYNSESYDNYVRPVRSSQ